MTKAEIIVIIGLVLAIIAIAIKDYNNYKRPVVYAIKQREWSTNVVIDNQTPYDITISGVGAGNGVVKANSQYSWFSQDAHNSKKLYFAQINLIGNLAFGQTAGVFVDRGWQQNNTVALEAHANDVEFFQDQNGGEQIVPWNGFENGGEIFLKFSMISTD